MTLPLSRPLLYLITNRQGFNPTTETRSEIAMDRQIESVRAAAQAGCHLIQIREKDLGSGELVSMARRCLDAVRGHETRLLINDRLDIALAIGADGVHLRTTSLPVEEVRRAVTRLGRADFIIGVSTHSVDEARRAAEGGADFIVCGPVYETPSKAAYGQPLGIAGLGSICAAVAIPVIELGGISSRNFRQPLAAGAVGIAGIALFQSPGGPARIIDEILKTPSQAPN